MKQEPVAFMNPTGLEYKQASQDFMYNDSLYPKNNNWIPLYTEPQYRELSDEEIGLMTTDSRWSHIETPLLYDFARAILKKASEK